MALQDSLNRGDDTRPKIYRMFGVEKELVELPLCRVDDYIAKLYNDIRIKAVLSSSLIEALARVTFVESPTSEELRLRCRKIEAYLDVSFPDLVFMQNVKVDKYQPTSRNDEEDVKGVGQPSEEQENDYKADQGMVGNVGQGAAAGPVRDHALFLLPEDYRQRRRHVIFMDDHLYNAIYSLKASQATGMFKLRYRDRHEGALRFFVMVCIVHELGHIVHTTFFSQSAPAKHGCEAGFAVEKRVFGGEVVLVHDHDEKGVDRQWDDVIGIRFVHDSAGSRYLSIDDKEHPLWFHFDHCEINNITSHTRASLQDYSEHPRFVQGHTGRTGLTSARYTSSTGHSVKTQGYDTRNDSARVSPCSIPQVPSDSTHDAMELRMPSTNRSKAEAKITNSRRGFKDVLSYTSG